MNFGSELLAALTSGSAPAMRLAVWTLLLGLLAWLIWQQLSGRRRAEAQMLSLLPELERLARVARGTSNAVVITNLQRQVVWVNAAFERITGFGAAEVLGRSPGKLLQYEGTDAATVARMRMALDAGHGLQCELRNRSKQGREYWLELEIQPLHSADGVLTGFMAIETEITERKRAEADLRASQAFLHNTGRIAGVGGWELDLKTGVMESSAQTGAIFELDEGRQPTLREFVAYFAPEAREVIKQAFDEGFAAGIAWDYELQARTDKGRDIWVHLAAEGVFADGGPVRLVGAIQDVSARRAMEAEVQRNAQLLRGAIEAVDEAFVLYGPDDRLLFCNDKYRALYATSADLIVPGARFEDVVRGGAERGQYPAAVGRVDDWVAERMQQHRSGNADLVQVLDNGSVLRVIERIMPDGHHVGFRIDITELVRAKDAAESANLAKSDFIATISHELRTPLQSIVGFSELGGHFAADQPNYRQMFEDIHDGGRRMLKLVNALLDVSKIDGTAGAFALVRRDVSTLVAEVVRELQPLAVEHGLAIEMPAVVAAMAADVDAFRLQQVLRNVLANAIRFAPAGSSIEIGLGHAADGGVEIGVRDHGPGIPPDELDAIFDAFVQSSRTRDGSGGTGLGLTICRKIMSAHRGSITAGNADGGGALMRVRLPAPALQGHAAASRAPATADEPSLVFLPTSGSQGKPGLNSTGEQPIDRVSEPLSAG